MSYFQGRLGRIAEVRGIKNILVRKQDFRYELRSRQCVVLVGTKTMITSPLTANLCTKNSQKTKNLSRTDLLLFTSLKEPRIPTGFDEKRIFHVEDGKAPPKGTPTLTHLEYRMKKILLGDDFLY